MTLLGEVSYPAIGTAETELVLFAVPRSVFLEIVLESPAFRVFVFNALSQRLAHLMALVDDVAFHRVDQRLASRLLLQRQPDANHPSDARRRTGDEPRSREPHPGNLPARPE